MTFRSYISAEELKAVVNLNNSVALNVFFVDFVDVDIEGFATMPWEVTAHSVKGKRLDWTDSEWSANGGCH